MQQLPWQRVQEAFFAEPRIPNLGGGPVVDGRSLPRDQWTPDAPSYSADVPLMDVGGYVMLGSDDYFLRMLQAGKTQEEINNYVAWTIHSSQCIGIKVVNPGGISAFKFNQRKLDLDDLRRWKESRVPQKPYVYQPE